MVCALKLLHTWLVGEKMSKVKGKEKEKKQLLLRNETKFLVKFITFWLIV
jgi:hypothetical protein